jgi:hypothetical protein
MKHHWNSLLLTLCVASLGVASAKADPPTRPPIFALVMGADEYHGKRLYGAVADANDIAAALKDAGAREIVLLTNAALTHAAMRATIADLAAKAARVNGWLFITYAGHGGQEDEHITGDEEDGKDETLILPGFTNGPPGNYERVLDNEIYELTSAIPKNVTVVLVADSCHSGTVNRGYDPRANGVVVRTQPYGPITDDMLPPPPAWTAHKEVNDLPNLIFVASSLDKEETLEVPIEGRPRGALSYAVARAIRGVADQNKDGVTTLGEFREYVTLKARALAQNRQTPGVHFLAGKQDVAMPFGDSASPIPPPPPFSLWTQGGPSPAPASGFIAAPSKTAADFLWDAGKHQIVNNKVGDMIAEMSPGEQETPFLAGVADKWRTLPALEEMAALHPLPIEIGPRGPAVLYTGGLVSIQVARPKDPALKYFTVVNLAGDGTVQYLWPKTAREAGPLSSGVGAFNNDVGAPYGADHVVALATAEAPVKLRQALEALNGHQAASALESALREAETGGPYAIGIESIYTGPTP